MALTQFDIDQQRETRRQQALQGMVEGFAMLDQQNKTKRQEALALQEQTRKLRSEGYDVTEDQVKKSLEPEQSGLSKWFAKTPIGNSMGFEVQAEKPDLYAKRTDEYKNKQNEIAEGRRWEREDRSLDRRVKNAQLANMGVESQKKLAEIAQLGNGKQMSATEVAKFDEGNQIPTMLQDIKQTIETNKDTFGPIAGRLAGLNPWDEKGQAIESQMTASAQSFGKFMEGGVLRAEDVPKYRKMFPNQSDTPETAANKLANVERLLAQKQNSTVGALKGAGYDVRSIDRGLKVPDAPSVITKSKELSNSAFAKDPLQIKQQLKGISREEKIRMLQGK